jgi:hypothetical protein
MLDGKMPAYLLIGTVLAVVAAGVLARKLSRRQLLAKIRAGWGKPASRPQNLSALAKAHGSRIAACAESSFLDDRTWKDLDMDDVLAAVDRTESTLGRQALYHRLRSAPVAEHLDAFEALVTCMSTDAPARERAQLALARLQDPDGYDLWRLARAGTVEHHAWYAVFPLLTAATIAVAAASLHWHALLPWLIALLVIDVGVRLVTAQTVNALGSAFWHIAPVVATGEKLAHLRGEDIAPIVGSLPADAARLRRLKAIARWLSGDPFMLSYGSGLLGMVVTAFAQFAYEYLNLILLLDLNGMHFGARDLRVQIQPLLRLAAAVGDIDAAISVASWREERTDWTRPRFGPPGSTAVLSGVRHPLVREAVPNSIAIEAGRGILITGSNMSGKSTFLRTVGVSAVLAQTIHTCLATAYEAPVFHVQSCIGRADDLIAGKSYYMVEVEAVLARVQASTRATPHLFLFDELFRGTNAVERIAAAEAVLRELTGDPGKPKPHAVLAATHDAELVDLLADVCCTYHFADTIGPEGLVFEYRLEPGPATTRNAIALLELQGAPASVVRRALTRAEALDQLRRLQFASSQKAG